VKGLRIVSAGRALPKKAITNEDLSKLVDTSDEWITTRTGIKQRFQCQEETTVSLAVEAAKQAIAKAEIPKEEIGAVIVATTTPDYAFPSAACLVQKELELNEEIMAFDISAACTGFLYGLKIAHGFINTLPSKYILLIGSEQMSKVVDYTDRSTCILFGDGAGAAILTASYSRFVQKTWTRGNKEVLYCDGVGGKDCHIHMKGNEVFKFAVTAMAQGIAEILKEADLTMADIDHVICHQANARIIAHVKKKYPEYAEKFYMNIKEYGNTSAASIPIVLDELLSKDSHKKSEKFLCVGFGAGLTWSAAILEGDHQEGRYV